jgi:hypothetical protein
MAEEPDIEEEFDDEALEVEVEVELDDELVDELDDEFEDDVVVVVEDDVEDDAEDDVVADDAPVKGARKGDDDDDDEEVADSDDVEADLSAILKDRIAAADDEDEEEEVEQVDTRTTAEAVDGVTPRRANEFMCTGCFLLVNRVQFGLLEALECPIGEADCPAITKIRKESRKK